MITMILQALSRALKEKGSREGKVSKDKVQKWAEHETLTKYECGINRDGGW